MSSLGAPHDRRSHDLPHGAVKSTTDQRSYAVAFLASAVFAVAASGCTHPADTVPSRSPYAIVEALADARGDSRTSESQIEILACAATSGDLPIEDYAASVNATVDCLRAGGISVTTVREVSANGVPSLEWGVIEPTGTDASTGELSASVDGLIDLCDAKHRVYVELAYRSQESSVEAAQAYFEERLPEVVQCAAEHGFISDSELSAHDQLRAIAMSDNPDLAECVSGFAWL